MVDGPVPPRNLPWFRFYTEFSGDPKIQSLAFEDQRHYVMLLCLKGSGVLDDAYPTEDRREAVIARALGLDRVSAAEALRRLGEAGLVDGDGQPLGWDGRQFLSDSAAERMRRYRQRLAAAKRSRYVTVTVQDSDSDSETSKSKAAPELDLACGYVDNSVDNPPAAPSALSQATNPDPGTPPRTNGRPPSLTHSDAIAQGLSGSSRLPARTLQTIVGAVRHVVAGRPDTPAEAVTQAVAQLKRAIDRGTHVEPWPYLLETIPLKADSLLEDRLEAEARERRKT